MTSVAVFLCDEARRPEWQLGALAPGMQPPQLVGWRTGVDDGVPPGVAQVLAQALCSVARVTFATSAIEPGPPSRWREADGDYVLTLSPGTMLGRARRWVGTSRPVTLRSSRNPASVAALFDDPGFPWWLQGQAALLTPLAADLPDLATADDDTWFSDPAVIPVQAIGSLRPAVDGDAAALAWREARYRQAFGEALRAACSAAGAKLQPLDEASFAAALAGEN